MLKPNPPELLMIHTLYAAGGSNVATPDLTDYLPEALHSEAGQGEAGQGWARQG